MDTTKEAGFWDGLKRRWRKWRGKGDFEGPTLSEDQVVKRFAEDMVEGVLWPLSAPFMRQVVLEANKANLPHTYLPYVFWILVENRQRLPRMHPKELEALKIGLDIVKSQGDMPNYRPALAIPPPELETAVDDVLSNLARWSLVGMGSQMLKGYTEALKKWTGQMARAVGESLPADKAGMYLRMLFETYLQKQPAHFLDGMLLERAIKLIR